MERINGKYIRVLAVILLAAGLFYAYFNVLNMRFRGSESRKRMREISEQMMSYPGNSARIECNSMLYILTGEDQEPVRDSSWNIRFILDRQHERLQVSKKDTEEIFEFLATESQADSPEHSFSNALWESGRFVSDKVSPSGHPVSDVLRTSGHFVSDKVYSKGISTLYIRDREELKNVRKDQWYYYPCREIYGVQWYKGLSERISYGYLTSEEHLQKIRYQKVKKTAEKQSGEAEATGEDKAEESIETAAEKTEEDIEELEEYIVQIKNTIRSSKDSKESDKEFRKTLSENGLHAMKLKKEYPEVYKMLKELYYQSTENMHVWMDKEGKMVRIEKDYTFPYYMKVMKENSEKIEQLVGKYQYPKVVCRQDYTYSPTCQNISLPKAFEQL